MRAKILFTIIFALSAAAAFGQAAAPAAPAARAAGVVTALDAANKTISIKTDAGVEMTLIGTATTKYKRVPPSLDAKQATEIPFAELIVGDRVTAAGRSGADGKSATVSTVYVLTKDDIAKKAESDAAEWTRRGVSGTITAVDAAGGKVTINARQPDGTSKPLVVVVSAKTRQRRYSPESIHFSDAVPGTLANLEVGDQLRALGARSEDGSQYTADDMISGGFRSLAATVISVDAASGTVKFKDLDTKSTITVKTNADSNLREMPAQTAQMMAARYMSQGDAAGRGGAGGAAGRSGAPGAGAAGAGGAPAGGRGAGGAGGPGGRGGRGGGDMQQMIDRMPVFKLADLKPGDALIISGAKGADPTVITAITMIKGVELILSATPPSQRPMVLGNWSVDVGGGGTP